MHGNWDVYVSFNWQSETIITRPILFAYFMILLCFFRIGMLCIQWYSVKQHSFITQAVDWRMRLLRVPRVQALQIYISLQIFKKQDIFLPLITMKETDKKEIIQECWNICRNRCYALSKYRPTHEDIFLSFSFFLFNYYDPTTVNIFDTLVS